MKNLTINYNVEKAEVTIKTDNEKAKLYRFDKEGEILNCADYRILFAMAKHLNVWLNDYVAKGYIFYEGWYDDLDQREEES